MNCQRCRAVAVAICTCGFNIQITIWLIINFWCFSSHSEARIAKNKIVALETSDDTRQLWVFTRGAKGHKIGKKVKVIDEKNMQIERLYLALFHIHSKKDTRVHVRIYFMAADIHLPESVYAWYSECAWWTGGNWILG